MKKKILKIITAFVLSVFIWQEIFSIGSTWSFFSDVEVSESSTFQAGTLDLEADSPTDNFVLSPEYGEENVSGYAASREVDVTDAGSIPFDYSVSTEDISGNEEFCDRLDIMATLEGNTEYVGSLGEFTVSGIEFNGGSDKWLFVVYSEAGGNLSSDCSFRLVFDAKQKKEDVLGDEDGFVDEEYLGNSLSPGGVVLNEFLPNPSGSEALGEWVELYNTSDREIDVAGWALYDSNDNHELVIVPCHVEGGSTVIPPRGFLVVYRKTGNKCTSSFTLNNSKDELRLYNGPIGDGGILIDSYAYDNEELSDIEATPGGDNDEPEDDGDEFKNDNKAQTDKSYARFPDGTGPWFDPIPTPGMPNMLESESDETDEDEKNDEYNDSHSIGYLNGETEVIIDNETGDIVEIVGEDVTVFEEERNGLEGGDKFVETQDISELASLYFVD